MISISPYAAERQTTEGWKPCTVLGVITSPSDLAPKYVVEYIDEGYACLAFEEYVRKLPPRNKH